MKTVLPAVVPAVAAPPIIGCRELPAFAPQDLSAVRRAFESEQPLSLCQSWLLEPEPALAPGSVRLGWKDDTLLVFAELTDADVFTVATKPNDRLWELGDTFEIFLRPQDQASCVELQIAPNNQRLQLRFPDADAVSHLRRTGDLQPWLITGDIFHSRTWVCLADQKWFVLASIATRSICEETVPLSGRRWRFSCGRYDFTRGRAEPVISSTSPHARLDFHRQYEWRALQFQPRLMRP